MQQNSQTLRCDVRDVQAIAQGSSPPGRPADAAEVGEFVAPRSQRSRQDAEHVIGQGLRGRRTLVQSAAIPPQQSFASHNNLLGSKMGPTTIPANTKDDPDWELLDDRRGALPDFPADALDRGWQHYVERAAHGAGVTSGHVAVPLITMISGLIGSARRIEASRSWTEPTTLWSAVVGFSGSGKTPGIDVSKRTLAFIEKARRGKITELRRLHETRAEIARAAQKKWKQQVKEATTHYSQRSSAAHQERQRMGFRFQRSKARIGEPNFRAL